MPDITMKVNMGYHLIFKDERLFSYFISYLKQVKLRSRKDSNDDRNLYDGYKVVENKEEKSLRFSGHRPMIGTFEIINKFLLETGCSCERDDRLPYFSNPGVALNKGEPKILITQHLNVSIPKEIMDLLNYYRAQPMLHVVTAVMNDVAFHAQGNQHLTPANTAMILKLLTKPHDVERDYNTGVLEWRLMRNLRTYKVHLARPIGWCELRSTRDKDIAVVNQALQKVQNEGVEATVKFLKESPSFFDDLVRSQRGELTYDEAAECGVL
jgi:hypothetical protein